jgi:hypothetical protein
MTQVAQRGSKTVTIANGASLSGAATLTGGVTSLVGIQMPAGWTAAAITFQASADGTTYGDVYTAAGTEVTIPSVAVAASRYIALDPSDFAGMAFLKLRSGTSAAAVAQGADRIITLIVRSL